MKKVVSFILVMIICALLCSCGKPNNSDTYNKDLSAIISIKFDMTQDDVIKYELDNFGNTIYQISEDCYSIGFAQYDNNEKTRYKHRYFFDETTKTLISAQYNDIIGETDEKAKCEHAAKFKEELLQTFETWDSQDNDGLFKYVNGNIDGISCKIQYQDGYEKGFSISKCE